MRKNNYLYEQQTINVKDNRKKLYIIYNDA